MVGPPIRGADCPAAGKVRFICGIVSPEDLVSIPGTDWVVASGFERGGALHVINARTEHAVQIFPTASPRVRYDARAYPGCPGPLDPAEGKQFSAHGLNVRPGRNGQHTLYVVHHGSRESMEIFAVDASPPVPTFTWTGCVVAPDIAALNAVAPLPDDGFVASSNYRRGDPDARARGHAGKNSGEMWEWHAASGWAIVPGSEAPGPNGVEVSADGSVLYVNLWPVRKIMRLSRRRTPVQRDEVSVPFHPDNIRWQTDGTLLSAGHAAPTIQRANECLRTMCGDASAKVARLDPRTMAVQVVVDYPSNQWFFGATAALQIGREIWIGSVRGDRIARYPIE
jgi:hypothetical protein